MGAGGMGAPRWFFERKTQRPEIRYSAQCRAVISGSVFLNYANSGPMLCTVCACVAGVIWVCGVIFLSPGRPILLGVA